MPNLGKIFSTEATRNDCEIIYQGCDEKVSSNQEIEVISLTKPSKRKSLGSIRDSFQKFPSNINLKQLFGRQDGPKDDDTDISEDDDNPDREFKVLEDMLQEKGRRYRRVTFSDEIRVLGKQYDRKSNNLFLNLAKKSELNFNFRKRNQEDEGSFLCESEATLSTLGMPSFRWIQVQTTSLDSREKKLVEGSLKLGKEYLINLEYEKAIKEYVQGLKILTKAGVSQDHKIIRSLQQRLNDIIHIVTLLKNSCKILRMGLEKENKELCLKALKFYTIALRMRHYALGESHVSHSTVLFMIARCQAKRDQFSESLQVYNLCLESLLSSTNKELPKISNNFNQSFFIPPSTLVTLRDMGSVFRRKGDLQKALSTFQAALMVHDVCIGPSESLTVLEKVKLDSTGQNLDTAEGTEAFVAIVTKNISSEQITDLDLAMTLYNLGQLYVTMGYYNMAIILYTASGEIMIKAMGKKDQNVAAIMGQIGNLLKECGDYDKAYETYKNVLKIEQKLLNENDSEITVTLHNMGILEFFRGNFSEALSIFQDVYNLQKKSFGENHLAVAITLNSTAEVYTKMRKYNEAINVYLEVKKILSKVLGRNSLEVSTLLIKLASLHYVLSSNLSAAERYCNNAIKTLKKLELAEDDAKYVEAMRLLADVKAARIISK